VTPERLAAGFAVLSVVCWVGLIATAVVSLFVVTPVWMWTYILGGGLIGTVGLVVVIHRNP
jgi:hypothetical protein